MPGPGQGKQGNKKKWRDNTLSTNFAAINAVIDTTATYPLASKTTWNTGTAATDANNETCVNTATTTSSMNHVDLQPHLSTYTHNEVQELLDEVWLEGWREGMDEGYKMGKQKGVEDGREECKKSLLEGHELGTQDGKEEE